MSPWYSDEKLLSSRDQENHMSGYTDESPHMNYSVWGKYHKTEKNAFGRFFQIMGVCLYELGFMEHTSENAFTNFCKEKSEKDMSFQNFPYSMINVILLDHQFHTVPQVIDKWTIREYSDLNYTVTEKPIRQHDYDMITRRFYSLSAVWIHSLIKFA